MTRYKRHIFDCTALDFLGVQDALIADGAVWSSRMPRFTSPEVGVIAIIVDATGQMTYTTYPSTVANAEKAGYVHGGFSVETKRFYTLDQPTVRPTLLIDGKVYDKADVLWALEHYCVNQVSAE